MSPRILIIGQAPPEKPSKIPYGRTRLYTWLDSIGLSKPNAKELIIFEALVDRFPGKKSGKHMLPTRADIEKHVPKLISFAKTHQDCLVVPVGKLAISEVLDIKINTLDEVVGRQYVNSLFGRTDILYNVVPLPHPSGLNSWIFKEGNDILLARALNLIKSNITDEN